MSSSSTSGVDLYSGLVITDNANNVKYTLLKQRASTSNKRYFYDAADSELTTLTNVVVTHGMKIVEFSGPNANGYREDLRAEYETNNYITTIGQSNSDRRVNHICGEVASCAVGYLELSIDGYEHGIIIYKHIRGMNLIYFFNHMAPKLEANPLTKRAAYFAFVEFVFKMAIAVCNITHVLHTFGVFHNDIKPDNFVISYDESEERRPIPNNFKIYVVDFGMTCAVKVPGSSHFPIPLNTRCLKDNRGFMRYGGTLRYLDPRATSKGVPNPGLAAIDVEQADTFSFFEHFETFSVGKTIAEYLNEDRYFASQDDKNVLAFLREMVKEMTGPLRFRKNIKIYEAFLTHALEIVQLNHMEVFNESPLSVIDEGYQSFSEAEESDTGSGGRRPFSNNDDDDNDTNVNNSSRTTVKNKLK